MSSRHRRCGGVQQRLIEPHTASVLWRIVVAVATFAKDEFVGLGIVVGLGEGIDVACQGDAFLTVMVVQCRRRLIRRSDLRLVAPDVGCFHALVCIRTMFVSWR